MAWQLSTTRPRQMAVARRNSKGQSPSTSEASEGSPGHHTPTPTWSRANLQIPVLPGRSENAESSKRDAEPITFRTGSGVDMAKAGPERHETLPNSLQTNIEHLAGTPMDDVEVHYNSREPSRFGAKAVTRDDQIHLSPGEEDQLHHEAWHAAQQKQGRVNATGNIDGFPVNSQPALEHEADIMGARASGAEVSGLGGPDFSGDTLPQISTPSVAQLKVDHDGSAYVGTSERPGWQVHAERDMARRYYQDQGEAYVDQTVDFKKLKLDRCHVASFDDIQSWIVNYLNAPGPFGEARLIANTNALLKYVVSSESAKGISARDALIAAVAGGDQDTIIAAANKFLGLMNSVSVNLRAANKYLNSYIGQRLDPTFEATPGGSRVRATAHTKSVMGLGSKEVQPVLLTPEHKSRVVTSEGGIPFGDMTPDTQKMMKAHPSTTRQAKSKNVRSALYPKGGASNPFLKKPPGGSTAPSAPKPKINLSSAPVSAPTPTTSATPMDTTTSPPTSATPMDTTTATSQVPSSGFGGSSQPFQSQPMNPYQIIQLQMSQLAAQYQQAMNQYNQNTAQIKQLHSMQAFAMSSQQHSQTGQQIQSLNLWNQQLFQYMATIAQQYQHLQSLLSPPTFSPGPT